jgi:hypothetical protein
MSRTPNCCVVLSLITKIDTPGYSSRAMIECPLNTGRSYRRPQPPSPRFTRRVRWELPRPGGTATLFTDGLMQCSNRLPRRSAATPSLPPRYGNLAARTPARSRRTAGPPGLHPSHQHHRHRHPRAALPGHPKKSDFRELTGLRQISSREPALDRSNCPQGGSTPFSRHIVLSVSNMPSIFRTWKNDRS